MGSSGSTGGLEVSLDSAEPGITVLALQGEVDLASAPALTAALDRVVHERDGHVVVNAAALAFCDASGIGALVVAHTELSRRGRRLTVVNPPGQLRRTLGLLGMNFLVTDGCGDGPHCRSQGR